MSLLKSVKFLIYSVKPDSLEVNSGILIFDTY